MSDRKFHYGWVVIFTGLLVTIGAHGFGRMSYTLILPAMKDGLHFSYTQLGLLGTGNFVGYLVMAIIGGFLAARYGTRIVIALALGLMGVTMILTGLAEDFSFAFSMRLMTGLGNGAAFVPAMALGSVWFTVARRGLATGIVSAGIGGGTMIAGLLVPLILGAYGIEGWRHAWYYLGGAVLVVAGLAGILIRSRPEDMGLRQVGSSDADPAALSPTAASPRLNWAAVYKTPNGLVPGRCLFYVRLLLHHFHDVLCRISRKGDGTRCSRNRPIVGARRRLEHILRGDMGRSLRQTGSRQRRGVGLSRAGAVLCHFRSLAGEVWILSRRGDLRASLHGASPRSWPPRRGTTWDQGWRRPGWDSSRSFLASARRLGRVWQAIWQTSPALSQCPFCWRQACRWSAWCCLWG